MRIKEHPILGTYEKVPLIEFLLDGKTMTGYEGEPIAGKTPKLCELGPGSWMSVPIKFLL